MLTQSDMVAIVKAEASEYQLFPEVMCAIAEQESAWNPWAIRYEPAFYEHYVAPLLKSGEVKSPTEATARAISWGLFQTMGQSVREIGFIAPMASLCEPATSAIWGCKLFTVKLQHAGGNLEKALALWNGGGAPLYPSQVLARVDKYK